MAANYQYSLKNFDIDLVNHLGKGAFGEVYPARNKTTGEKVAVKKIKYDYNNWSLASNELKALQKLNGHPNIINLYDFHKDGSNLWIFMEFCELGDLDKYIVSSNPSFNKKLDLIAQCANAIAYMHSLQSPVIHRDIKPNNILVKKSRNGEITVKIGDFGLAKLFQDVGKMQSHLTMLTVGGTLYFMAPEFFDSRVTKYYPPVDTFSLGLVFYVVVKYNGAGYLLPNMGAGLPVGMSMTNDVRSGRPIQPLYKVRATDEPNRAEVKRIINGMVQYRDSDRTKLSEVKRRLENLRRPQEQPIAPVIKPAKRENENGIVAIKGNHRRQLPEVDRKTPDIFRKRLVEPAVMRKRPEEEALGERKRPTRDQMEPEAVAETVVEERTRGNKSEEETSYNMRTCLKCQNFCVRTDDKNPRAICAICRFEFCWNCKHPWNGSGTKCENSECADLRCQLANCDMKYIDDVEVYCLRVCPNCNTLLQHETDSKHVECYRCKVNFCFVCLVTSTDGEFECYGEDCELAPVQLM